MLTEFLSFWCSKRLKWLTWWWVGSGWVVFYGVDHTKFGDPRSENPALHRPVDLGDSPRTPSQTGFGPAFFLGSRWFFGLLLCEFFGALGMINPASFSPSTPWGAEEWSNPIIILTHFFVLIWLPLFYIYFYWYVAIIFMIFPRFKDSNFKHHLNVHIYFHGLKIQTPFECTYIFPRFKDSNTIWMYIYIYIYICICIYIYMYIYIYTYIHREREREMYFSHSNYHL